MKIAYISTSLPNQCGIATFNANLSATVYQQKAHPNQCIIIAITDSDETDPSIYPEEVKFIIRKNYQEDYINAAEFINESSIDICVIEHEFGIYGGDSGLYLLTLMARLHRPIVSILHTVLRQPTYIQQTIIQQIARRSSRIIVMSQKAIGFLISLYHIQKSKISYIAHGVPDREARTDNPVKQTYPFKDHTVLLTFGLISPNKGLETVIAALPSIIKAHPKVKFVVLGNTHPGVLKHAGEEYRKSLCQMAQQLNVEHHLIFINKFVDENELFQYLSAADIYISPYLNEAQITSGTLSYAVGAGAAVFSTPYWHAQELLAQKRGILFDFKNSVQLAELVNDFLHNPTELNLLKQNAYQYGLSLRWPVIGRIYLKLFEKVVENYKEVQQLPKSEMDVDHIPPFDLSHIIRLTDHTGIVQHAKYGIPNLKEGYCLDDNARALIMSLMAYELYKSKEALDLLPIYLSYVQYMQKDDGNFRNFLSFSRQYLDETGSEDSFGRTIWALGYLVNFAPNNSYKEFANEVFLKSVPHFSCLKYLRGMANTLIGVHHYLITDPKNEHLQKELHSLALPLIRAYERNKDENWHWFEETLTYDNAILPLALLCYYESNGDAYALQIGLESLSFLSSHTLSYGYLNPVGNEGWLRKNVTMAIYDQQAIETMAMVLVYYKAYQLTGDDSYLQNLYQSYQWFLGENSLNLPLYDHETKGCADGLQPHGVNRNQGAESTLAYLISHLIVFKTLETEYRSLDDEQRALLQLEIKSNAVR